MASHFTVKKTGPNTINLDFDVVATNEDVAFLACWLLVDVEHKHFIAIKHLTVVLVHLCVVYQVSQLWVNG